jgi:hypothetical protein
MMVKQKHNNQSVWLLSIFGILSVCGVVLINVDITLGGIILIIIAFVFLIAFIVSLIRKID